MNKMIALVVSLWLASPAAAQNASLIITGSINGVTNGSNYSLCPAPTGPGQIFFNKVDIYSYTHPTITPASTPPPTPGPANLNIFGTINGSQDASHYSCPSPTGPGQIIFNGIDIYIYTHPTPTPSPIPTPATTPAPTPTNAAPLSQPVAPQAAAAPAAAPAAAIAASTAPVKNTTPVAAAVAESAAKAAKARTAAAEARKKKFERLSRKLDALADKLGASKIDARKKSTLLAQVKNLTAQLKDPAGKLTIEAAEEAFAKLNDNFAGAAESAASRP